MRFTITEAQIYHFHVTLSHVSRMCGGLCQMAQSDPGAFRNKMVVRGNKL